MSPIPLSFHLSILYVKLFLKIVSFLQVSVSKNEKRQKGTAKR